MDGFQRRLSSTRADEIAEYLNTEGNSIPINIVLSAQPEAEFRHIRENKGISFKRVQSAFVILDGQHRMWGYHKCPARHRVPVAIYEGLSRADEVRLFVDINTKHQGVPKALILDVKGLAGSESDEEKLLRELFDLSLAASTSALSIYLLGGSAGLILGGFLAKPGNQHEHYVLFAFASGAVIALVLAFVPLPKWLVLPLMAMMGFGIAIAGPSRDLLVRAATKARLGEGAYGRVYGTVYSGLDVGLAVAPIAFGLLLDHQYTSLVFIGVALSLVCGIVAALALGREVVGRPA